MNRVLDLLLILIVIIIFSAKIDAQFSSWFTKPDENKFSADLASSVAGN